MLYRFQSMCWQCVYVWQFSGFMAVGDWLVLCLVSSYLCICLYHFFWQYFSRIAVKDWQALCPVSIYLCWKSVIWQYSGCMAESTMLAKTMPCNLSMILYGCSLLFEDWLELCQVSFNIWICDFVWQYSGCMAVEDWL